MYISFIDKKTGKVKTCESHVLTEKNITQLEKAEKSFNSLYIKALEIRKLGDINNMYNTYFIPKRNGKMRRIDEPNEELKKFMRQVNMFIKWNLNFVFPECCYAYVKGRNTRQLASCHTHSVGIIKLDIKDFFPSCTLDFILDIMLEVYPFCLLDYEKLETIVKTCMLYYDGDYRLPQGAPTSPTLSNIAMVKFDYEIMDVYKDDYTRYADDLIFSVHYGHITRDDLNRIRSLVEYHLPSQFTINHEKTCFHRAKSGNLRVCGIYVGETDSNDLKIGSKNKQYFKAMIWSFLMDTKNGKVWSKHEIFQMEGKVNYYRYIEPDFVNNIIHKYEKRTGIDYNESVENILC